MTDEKQILEMAKVIRSILESRTDITFIPDLDKPIAEELAKKYQPKLPEDSVVLTNEELHERDENAYQVGVVTGKNIVRTELPREILLPLLKILTMEDTSMEIDDKVIELLEKYNVEDDDND